MSDDNNSKKSGFFSAIIGAIAGVIAGVFALAPKGAKENRADLKIKANKVKDGANVRLSELQTELKNEIEEVKGRAKEASGSTLNELKELQTKLEAKRREVLAAIEDEQQDKDSVVRAAKELVRTVRAKLNK